MIRAWPAGTGTVSKYSGRELWEDAAAKNDVEPSLGPGVKRYDPRNAKAGGIQAYSGRTLKAPPKNVAKAAGTPRH